MKLLYTPFQIVTKIVSNRIGKDAFSSIWSRFSDLEKPPAATAGHRKLTHVAGAAALEAATLAAFTAVGQQLTARLFHYLFGAWPERPKEAPPHPDAAEV
jgi:Protein of unknown function (DUF4235)